LERTRRRTALFALLLVLSLIAAACGGDDDGDNAGDTTDTTEAEEAVKGGTAVFGAEQEPDCADWIATCAGASWGVYTMAAHTMPRSFDFDPKTSELKPSILLDGEPELDEGPPQKVTYKLNEDAVWSDGTPITSADYKYTWEQIVNGEDIYDKTGYDQITSVDDSKPKEVVVTFKSTYAAWKDLFGGFYGIYPKHIVGTGDEAARNAAMKDGYKWSGGPWMVETWTKGQEVKLVPNPKWYGKKANLDAVVFKFIPDTAAEQQAYKTGQVSMIYPQAQLELADLKTLPDTEFDVISSLSYEAVWINTTKEPVNSKAVRQALAYATDREAAVKTLFGPVQEDIEPIHAFITPANKQWYSDPFKKYTRDLDKVDELMTGDGWKKGADGIWEKNGKKAEIENSTTSGNKRRELTQEILASQWKEAGFLLKVNNTKAATLFGEWGPQGVYMTAVYAQVPSSTDPAICSVFCSESIPTADKPSGTNWTRLSDPKIDKPLKAAELELDEDKRKDLMDEGHAAIAEGVPGIPVDPFPDIIIYNTSKLKGPIGHNFVYGPWYNVNEWSCDGGAC
jgi:peptide/nickel transport system substrate-binding protein